MLWIIFIVSGLILGSFFNVLIYRLPRKEDFVRSRSRCPKCSVQLQWFDLVPVLSFVSLRGRCRYCKNAISWQYPLIELASAAVACLALWRFGNDLQLAAYWFIIGELILILSVFDLKYLILPNELIVALAGFATAELIIVSAVAGQPLNILSRLIAGFVLAGLLWLLWYFSGGRSLGLGDVKLVFILGLIFGLFGALFVIYLAVLIGGIVSVILLITKRATLKTQVPLGLFIGLSALFTVFIAPNVSYIFEILRRSIL